MRLLGIDYGDKNIGLALADIEGPALPFKILENKDKKFVLESLKDLIESENIEVVVVGLPHSLSGKENERLRVTRDFVSLLENDLNIKVATVDEQITSKMYAKLGITKEIDKHAATAILDTYISLQNG
ncbi:Holliday junction resolvase RuvX [Candidatus Parcubacteria bacterium]|nr:MAG: Holliday junction resolvase RuvX [Candidatus Parcubacteria bacterium]